MNFIKISLIVYFFSSMSNYSILIAHIDQTIPTKDSIKTGLELIAAWVPQRIIVNQTLINPKDGYVFVAVQTIPKGLLSLGGEFIYAFDKDDNVVGITAYIPGWGSIYSGDVKLKDSKGRHYSPVGCISYHLVFFQSKSMMTDVFKLTAPDGQSYIDEALVYLYEIPKGAKRLKLIIQNSQIIPIEVNTK